MRTITMEIKKELPSWVPAELVAEIRENLNNTNGLDLLIDLIDGKTIPSNEPGYRWATLAFAQLNINVEYVTSVRIEPHANENLVPATVLRRWLDYIYAQRESDWDTPEGF